MKDNPKILDDLAGYVDATKNSDGDAVLASKWVNTPDGDVRYDLTLGTVRAMYAENGTMRVSLQAAIRGVLRPVWDALLAHLVPIWKMIEPILETDTGYRSTCVICDGQAEYIDPHDGQPGVWRHVQMPADHEVQLVRGYIERERLEDGDTSVCKTCGASIKSRREYVGDGVYNLLWSHVDELIDQAHDAKPW